MVSWFAVGFECLDHTPRAPWPAWLTQAIWPPKPSPESAPRKPAADNSAAVNGILRKLQDTKEGSRNAVLYWSANRLRERGISRSECEGLLLPIAMGVGLQRGEASATIGSAWRSAS